jgi:hypothetical protein
VLTCQEAVSSSVAESPAAATVTVCMRMRPLYVHDSSRSSRSSLRSRCTPRTAASSLPTAGLRLRDTPLSRAREERRQRRRVRAVVREGGVRWKRAHHGARGAIHQLDRAVRAAHCTSPGARASAKTRLYV